ncbi:hypothetical protein D3C81_1785480 [compost metagenome]
MPVIALADIGKGQFARGALQQAHIQAGLQLGHPPRQARLRQPQLAPGRGEATGFHHLGEVVQVIEVLHGIVLLMRRCIAFLLTYRRLATSVALSASQL